MKAIIALEELIRTGENRVALAKKQLAAHESGETKLTRMVKASTEESLEENTLLLEKHRNMLAELLKQDIKELEEKERIREATERKNYYHYQKVRLKRDITKTNDEKIEAMMIVDELPEGINIDDREVFEIAIKSIELHLTLHENIENDLQDIRKDFEEMTKHISGDGIKDLGLFKYRIPIVVLQLHTLLQNIKQNIAEEELPPFRGFPRFEDWWIDELWTSHQAYLGLYKWRKVIKKLCISSDQKRAWKVIFANWVFIKKYLNGKGPQAYEYNFAFDTLVRKYAELEDELEEENLISMKKLIEQLTPKEDFLAVSKKHNVVTPYIEYKRKKLEKIAQNKKQK
jgi:hypothetical protein